MPTFHFEDPAVNPTGDVILGFVVGSGDGSCTPSWGTRFSLEQAAAAPLELDARLETLRAQSGYIAVSFGGAAHTELALRCPDADALAAAYAQVVDRYRVTAIDFDVEGAALDDAAANERRAAAARYLQDRARKSGTSLSVGLTLPVGRNGLTQAGLAVLDGMLAAGVDISTVNAMTMNFAGSRPPGASMYDAAAAALEATASQVTEAYARAGSKLADEEVWARLGATPMVGMNDVAGDVFTLDDARRLRAYAAARRLGRLSMWSANRDLPCPGSIGSAVSDRCSGVQQEPSEFARILGSAYPEPS